MIKIILQIHTEQEDYEIDPKGSVKTLKERIQQQTGVPIVDQKLIFKAKALNDNDCLSDHNIQHLDKLYFQVNEKELTFEADDNPGTTGKIKIPCSSTVKQLKGQISEKLNKEQLDKNYAIFFNEHVLLNDSQILSEFDFSKGNVIKLSKKMSLSIQNNQTVFNVRTCGHETLGSLKKQIALDQFPNNFGQEDLGSCQQKLRIFRNKEEELKESNKTLNEYGITEKSSLELELTEIRVLVRDKTGKTICFSVGIESRIEALKHQIEKKFEVPVQKQILHCGNRKLEDSKTFKEYGLKNETSISLISQDNITLIIMSSSKGKLKMKIDKSENIIKTKEIIKDKFNIPVEKQILVYKPDKHEVKEKLSDDLFIDKCGLKDNSTIELFEKIVVNIIMKSDGSNGMKVYADPDESILLLKQQICQMSNLSSKEYLLINDKQILDDDEKTLRQYGIIEDATLHLVSDSKKAHQKTGAKQQGNDSMTIAIKDLSGEIVTLEQITPDNTIKDIKCKIRELLGYPVSQQNLFIENTLLEDTAAVSSYDFKTHNTVWLMLSDIHKNLIRIFIKTCQGEAFDIELSLSATLKELKHQIESELKCNRDNLTILHAGRLLKDDNKSLLDYNLQNETALTVIQHDKSQYLREKLTVDQPAVKKITHKGNSERDGYYEEAKTSGDEWSRHGETSSFGYNLGEAGIVKSYNVQITIKTLGCENYVLEIPAFSPLQELKEKIEKDLSIPVKQQRLVLDGKELQDDSWSIAKDSFLYLMKAEAAHLVRRNLKGNAFIAECDGLVLNTVRDQTRNEDKGLPIEELGEFALIMCEENGINLKKLKEGKWLIFPMT